MKHLLLTALVLLSLGCTEAKSADCSLQHSMSGMPQDAASCMAFMPAWSYDAAQNTCVEFIFGGCGGNKNQFGSQKECEAACKN